jgi:hypothetical protein
MREMRQGARDEAARFAAQRIRLIRARRVKSPHGKQQPCRRQESPQFVSFSALPVRYT